MTAAPCIPAEAGLQSGLPPSREHNGAMMWEEYQ